jgi:hypothetical protein
MMKMQVAMTKQTAPKAKKGMLLGVDEGSIHKDAECHVEFADFNFDVSPRKKIIRKQNLEFPNPAARR